VAAELDCRPPHDHKAGPVEMLGQRLGSDPRHAIGGLVVRLASVTKSQRVGKRVDQIGAGGWGQSLGGGGGVIVGHAGRVGRERERIKNILTA
jgi:hypothetical protein